jgi:group I intron endonuclease
MENSLKNSKSYIYNALLKHGRSNFSLTILEYCDKEKCIEREDFYMSSFKHEYNILEKAGSRLGHKHSDESKKKIKDVQNKMDNPGRFKTGENHTNFGKTLSDETRKKISDAMKGENNPMHGQPKPEGAGSPCQQIEVFDLQEKTTTSYNSINAAARALNINQARISEYFYRNQQKPYKGRYTFKKVD